MSEDLLINESSIIPGIDDEPARQNYFMEQCRELVRERASELGHGLTYNITTFGCQMNAKDSEKLAGILEYIGFTHVESEDADLVIYNTCTVRENANTRVYGRIGYLGNLKKKHPEKLIGICGCMMQEPEEVEKIKKTYRFVDIVFGTFNIYKLAELLFERLSTGKRVFDIWTEHRKIVENLPSAQKFSFKAGVNIMYGCNNFCSYCIVPYVRGRERSRAPEDIEEEIRCLVKKGVVEIMLLGQNVNSYGLAPEKTVSFPELLERVAKIDGIRRIRFMTSHPKDLSEELIDVMAKYPKICNHVHLPLQSGSSRILKIMNRKYDKEKYLSLVDMIRKKLPDASITTDIIVGFPGETEEDFLETVDVVKRAGYDSAYTFIYSKRSGTPAAKMDDQIPEDVVKDRFNRLLKVVGEESEKAAMKLEGKTMEVLVEEENTQNPELMTGRLSNNMLVHFKGDRSMLGTFKTVYLKECKGFYYLGEIT